MEIVHREDLLPNQLPHTVDSQEGISGATVTHQCLLLQRPHLLAKTQLGYVHYKAHHNIFFEKLSCRPFHSGLLPIGCIQSTCHKEQPSALTALLFPQGVQENLVLTTRQTTELS